jgi:hypothetical protein
MELPYGIARWRLNQHVHLRRHRLCNPDAVTQIANGLSTTSLTYDSDGNVIQKTTDGVTTTYSYDYVGGVLLTRIIPCPCPPSSPRRLTNIRRGTDV